MRRSPIGYVKERFGTNAGEKAPRIDRICGGEARIAPLNSLVLGHDRQPESRDALDVALDLAERLRAFLHIVHVVSLDDYPIDPDRADWEVYARERLAEEQAMVTAALRDHATGWTYYVGRGDPALRLNQVAKEHDALMVIVGSRGEGVRASLGRLIEPAVSHRLIQEARFPVLVVRHPHKPSGHSPVLHAVAESD